MVGQNGTFGGNLEHHSKHTNFTGELLKIK